MAKANLLVTFDPTHAESAKKEIESLLKEVKVKADVLSCEEGLAEVSVGDARKAVLALRKLKKDKFEHTFHWTPIDHWCKATIPEMQKVIKGLAKDINVKEKWRMDLGRRKTKEHERDLIIKLTDVVDRPKVDLSKPDKIVKVEIIGDKAGIALLKKDELLNVVK